jgi:hypothetical protein
LYENCAAGTTYDLPIFADKLQILDAAFTATAIGGELKEAIRVDFL